ncbi:NAD(+) diphosphatase [Alteromonas sp. 14N.309.X.WAT.G.H12]|uniref:NAD(+) diphosphatase n=1 Tax=Alteromonas sp. 14N.309.X.WAT.G.H12 TaxID=3120824 RepID=UPI002FD2A7D0
MIRAVTESQLSTCEGIWVIFSRDQLLVKKHTPVLHIGRWQELDFLHHHQSSVVELLPLADSHKLDKPVFVIDLGAEFPQHPDWELCSMRSVLGVGTDTQFYVVARAWQYVHFLRTHRYCGQCGGRTEQVDWEMAVQCHQCKHRAYPRISPCIIVAIYRDNQILLAKGVRHKDSNMYSTLAGFVESGESLEHAVHREVEEEVNVKIKNLSYFGSQPWPFPHSLMMGYLAEYESGDIIPQEGEIVDAQWFDVDKLPTIPPKMSIAGRLIDAVVRKSLG